MGFKVGNFVSGFKPIGKVGTGGEKPVGAIFGTNVGDKLGFGVNHKQKAANDEMKASQETQKVQTKGIMGEQDKAANDYYGRMKDSTDKYVSAYDSATGTYLDDKEKTKRAYQTQASDSSAAYSNQVLPRLTSIMDQRKGNADAAMSLKDAQDPNNKVASATRDMYNTQAQGIQNQGLADYGVLAALGSQATGHTIGGYGGMLTGGQMQSMQNANMGQASGAFGRAQQNANDLKLKGIDAGTAQSNWAYGQGQQAIGDYSGSVRDYEGANNRKNDIQKMYTGLESDIDTDAYGVRLGQSGVQRDAASGLAGLQNANSTASLNRQQGFVNGVSSTDQATAYAHAQAAAAAQAAKLGALGTIAGGVVGAYAGGPAGAAVGAKAGGTAAASANPGAGTASTPPASGLNPDAGTASTPPASGLNLSAISQGAQLGGQVGAYGAQASGQPIYRPGQPYNQRPNPYGNNDPYRN